MLSKEAGILLPYLVSLFGVLSDYLTKHIGLGFTETNPPYDPARAVIELRGEVDSGT